MKVDDNNGYLFGDSSGQAYTSIPISKSSSPTSNMLIPTSPAETSLMEGLKDVNIQLWQAETSPKEGLKGINIQPFIGIPNMRKFIEWQLLRAATGMHVHDGCGSTA
jgi:hypothetical protein